MRSGCFFLGFFYLTYQKVEIIWLLTTHKPLFPAGISRPASAHSAAGATKK
jgi:hypothetical protein